MPRKGRGLRAILRRPDSTRVEPSAARPPPDLRPTKRPRPNTRRAPCPASWPLLRLLRRRTVRDGSGRVDRLETSVAIDPRWARVACSEQRQGKNQENRLTTH